jgi:hypothetical protein
MVRMVVVKFNPVMLEHQDKPVYAMCIQELGLTAYGKNPKEARVALENLFHSFITGHRGQDSLEQVLKLSGLEWSWEDQYKDDLPYKYAKPIDQPTVQVAKVDALNKGAAQSSDRSPRRAVPSGNTTSYDSSFAPVPEGLGLAA